ncbi:hypothetical protein SAMN05421812_11699 [Asanoa hainanensis]|uniref:Uncharacterized protein n=1 Tax=Asanoa hainanensis TaxID=560556 RepID=A0A239PB30_9ACTN|nr:hypothetical protein [Asanoa hainanensis]SNT64093.1 hypothetical protein SAMN05421812_11699 [Asanoa hainanensis]
MKLIRGRHAGAGLAVVAGAMAFVALAASPAAASPVFCGAGRGLTAENAIWGAMDDAANSAQSMGFYGQCTLTEPAQIFEVFDDPRFGHLFRAQVLVTCLP